MQYVTKIYIRSLKSSKLVKNPVGVFSSRLSRIIPNNGDIPYPKFRNLEKSSSLKDLPCPGQAHIENNNATISVVDELIRQNCRITTREIAVELSISKGTVHHIIHKKLGYGKVCVQCVPKHLSENQKTARMGVCLTQKFLHKSHPLPFYALGPGYQCQWRLFIVALFHMNCN
ncbi:hypothetical protein AVEN_219276-1 [Araneus ventricosus]|uniref:Uncharacterized protein n=1 Tax=Araneus ventricosus TaxID=182803 RepID=A0A4Y2T1C9_ARAVE|nr:hypothetical protein AVEN_219276-1 [Araneus ventricosus]